MSDIIHLLPDAVANQIAAGEVIQRPASVIKELVENALDAKATHIQILVEDAGKSLVQVIDNGCGMSATDARLSFERHATSKISTATDLFSLRTMGFRGEALASIAAVAQVELRTKQKDEELGTSLKIEGSKMIEQSVVVCPVGANFAIKNLFFNIPARRKFLKTNQTELSNMMTEVERIALAHPELAITFKSNGNTLLDLPNENFRKRIVNLFGKKMDTQLVPVETKTTLVNIRGYVGTPAAARRKSPHQYFFVNGRYMRHPYFTKAILTAFDRLITEGMQIPFFLCLEVDPSRIDVNIHPTKTEIKFEDDNAIFQILLAAIREALGKYGAVPRLEFDTENCPDIPVFKGDATDKAQIAPPQVHIDTSFNPFKSSSSSTNAGGKKAAHKQVIDWSQVFENAQNGSTETPTESSPTVEKDALTNNAPTFTFTGDSKPTTNPQDAPAFEINPADSSNPPAFEVPTEEIKKPSFAQKPNEFTPASATYSPTEATTEPTQQAQNLFQDLPSKEQRIWNNQVPTDYLQHLGRYIITVLGSKVSVIDCYRAQTRILYERFMRQLEEHAAPSQRLLFPEIIQLSPAESVVLEGIAPSLQEVGFDLSPLGGNSYSILATPIGTEDIAPTHLVQSILNDAVEGQANASDTINQVIALSLAKKVGKPTGKPLRKEEMQLITKQLLTTSNPQLTPDGKNIIRTINLDNIF